MKKIFIALLCLVVPGAAWYIFTDGAMTLEGARQKLLRKARGVVTSANIPSEDVAALAMKAIEMTQGEHGAEIWRLKAEWGNMRRNDEIMELEKPRFTYYMPPDGKAVVVVSDKGEINQDDQIVRFITNVVATHENRTVLAPLMVYAGKTRQVTCPQGGRVASPSLEGTADRIVWRLQDKILEGLGNVDMTFRDDTDTATPPAQPEAGRPVREGTPE